MINLDEFICKYKPIKNPLKCNTILFDKDPMLVQTFQDFIINKAAWTLIRKYNTYILVPGYITGEEAFGYVFTAHRWENIRIEVAYIIKDECSEDGITIKEYLNEEENEG